MNPLSTQSLLAAFGALGLRAVMFAGTGLLDGFFLPGDSLLLLVRYGHAKAIVPAGCVPVVRTVLSRSRGPWRCPPGWSPCGRWSAARCAASA
ncbi:hypothetical protein GCM10010345_19690 [Streptomyces canarius]|uniref:Uncharacterized protein n=1 Tax=Streptomyces canarius TaxID=285453 RepID=A0ABQ3CHN0_9ACTN|nr:hypothetical protein GCM10010345_19690 [Streptomyces canarius]